MLFVDEILGDGLTRSRHIDMESGDWLQMLSSDETMFDHPKIMLTLDSRPTQSGSETC